MDDDIKLVDKLIEYNLSLEKFNIENPWDIFYYIGWPVGRVLNLVEFYDEDKKEFIFLNKAPKSFLNEYYNMFLGNDINLEITFGKNKPDKILKTKIHSDKGFTPFKFLEEIMKIYNTSLTGKENIYNLKGEIIKNTFQNRLPLELITFNASLFGFEQQGDGSYRIIFDYY